MGGWWEESRTQSAKNCRVEGKCTAEMWEEKLENKGKVTAGKESEGKGKCKQQREWRRQIRTQGRDKGRNWDTQEWSCSSALASAALWCFLGECAMVTMARLSVKVSLKSLGQAEDTAGSPPHLGKILSCNKQFKTAAADKTSTSKYKSNWSADLSFFVLSCSC